VKIGQGQSSTYQLAQACDAIAVSLSEDGQNFGLYSPTWQLDVWVGTDAGKVYVGTLNTVAAKNGAALARVIGHAYFPGARSWSIEATGPTSAPPGVGGSYQAELRAHPVGQAPGGMAPGFSRTTGRTILNGQLTTETGGGTTAPLASNRTDYIAPIAFGGAWGDNETAATLWIMWFNSVTLPANGTEPFLGLSFRVPVGGSFNFVSPDASGIFFSQGLTWAASTTGDTLTLAGANAARVMTSALW
jgi:hypothetical protein